MLRAATRRGSPVRSVPGPPLRRGPLAIGRGCGPVARVGLGPVARVGLAVATGGVAVATGGVAVPGRSEPVPQTALAAG
jgi:hypothetical protein